MTRKLGLILVLFGFMLLALTACSAEDVEFLQAMAEEWATAKNINPQNSDGSINVGGLFNAGLSAAGLPGGDDDAKAIIAAKGVVDSIQAADKAAEDAQKALKAGNPQQAINLLNPALEDRPSDWWLLNQRGVANLEAGNGDLGNRDLQSAYGNAKRGQAAEHQRQLLFDSIARQRAGGALARCSVYTAMANAYSDLLNSGGGDADFYRSQIAANRQAASQPGVTCR
ncbi:MAG: hypothetical protein HY782_19575 [Chloroflexi bacterium]|nr:hypothetical protein [Chloroflexota bacterium]